MYLKDFGLVYKNAGEVIEKVSSKFLDIGLMASFDGTEIIYHKLLKNSNWVIGPDEGWNALEFVYILSGELILNYHNDKEKLSLKKGDYIKAIPIKKTVFSQQKLIQSFFI